MASVSRLIVGLILVTGTSLTACGDKSESDVLVPESVAENRRMEDQFGKGFGEAYRADPNSEPANVSEMELAPVSYTTEPVLID